MQITGAAAILQGLLREGVDILFGYPGGTIMPTYDALYDVRSELRHILVRHEQGAVHAAQGYARVTGKPGVCIVTSGPGATNLITGITDAMLDSTPLVCITGQVASEFLGTDAFQEADIVGISLPVTKWSCQITHAAEIPAAIAKAFFIAKSGRPGPVLLDITKDAQFASLDFSYQPYVPENKPFYPHCNPSLLQQAAERINAAQRPYILAGQGITLAKAELALQAFAEKIQAPVACTLLGLSTFPMDHPLYAGMLGMHGNYGPNLLTNQADLIIAIGMRFDDRVTGNLNRYAKQAKIIHIDIDPAEINKNVPVDLALVADANDVLQALMPYLEADRHNKPHEHWIEQFHACHKIEYDKIMRQEIKFLGKNIKMARVINELSEKTPHQTVIVTDVGQHQMVAARYFQFKRHNSLVTSGGLGTMGFALPAAIGAKLGQPQCEVIAIIGDGGFQMNIQELGVIAQENLPVKIVILNNSHLGMVRQWQELFFEERYSFVQLKNPDFVKIAEGYGIAGQRVSDGTELDAALETLLNYPGPYLLEIMVEMEENIFPMIPAGCGVGEIRLS
ncbi:MAG: biosynthetic-type acetolactate synthase large subunit [Gammaproteobacteria bacterium]